MLYNSPVSFIKIKASDGFIYELIYIDEETESAEEIKFFSTNQRILQKCIRQFGDYFSGGLKKFAHPLMQQGTLLQQSSLMYKYYNSLI